MRLPFELDRQVMVERLAVHFGKRLVRPSIDTGSIALSVEIITIALAPAASAASATLTSRDVGLDPFAPVALGIGTCFRAAA